MCGEGRRAWLERRPLQRAVRILLECILVDPCSCTPIQTHCWDSIPGCVWHSVRSNRLNYPAGLCDIAFNMYSANFARKGAWNPISKQNRFHFRICIHTNSLSLSVNVAEYLEIIKSWKIRKNNNLKRGHYSLGLVVDFFRDSNSRAVSH